MDIIISLQKKYQELKDQNAADLQLSKAVNCIQKEKNNHQGFGDMSLGGKKTTHATHIRWFKNFGYF